MTALRSATQNCSRLALSNAEPRPRRGERLRLPEDSFDAVAARGRAPRAEDSLALEAEEQSAPPTRYEVVDAEGTLTTTP